MIHRVWEGRVIRPSPGRTAGNQPRQHGGVRTAGGRPRSSAGPRCRAAQDPTSSFRSPFLGSLARGSAPSLAQTEESQDPDPLSQGLGGPKPAGLLGSAGTGAERSFVGMAVAYRNVSNTVRHVLTSPRQPGGELRVGRDAG